MHLKKALNLLEMCLTIVIFTPHVPVIFGLAGVILEILS